MQAQTAASSGVIAIDAQPLVRYPAITGASRRELTRPLKHASSLFMAVANNPFTRDSGARRFLRDRLQRLRGGSGGTRRKPARHQPAASGREDHHSVTATAVYQGLQWLFQGYQAGSGAGRFNRRG